MQRRSQTENSVGNKRMKQVVSVVIPIYNCANFLRESIGSIQAQTYSNLEILCIDDGSTDGSQEIVTELARKDSRIRLIENSENLGISATLNKAISQASGDIIARMDADDLSLPERIMLQVNWLENEPELQILGSWLKLFGARTGTYHYRKDANFIKALFLFFSNGFPHNAVCYRKSLWERYQYDSNYDSVEDTELWCRIISCEPDIKIANIPQVLALYRMHTAQTSVKRNQNQQKLYQKIVRSYIQFFFSGDEVNNEQITLHNHLVNRTVLDSVEDVERVGQWVNRLYTAFSSKIDDDFLAIDEKWWQFSCAQKVPEALSIFNKYSVSTPIFSFF